MTHPADLDLTEASSLLRSRDLSAAELTEACLARIAERDGTHSFDGDPGSINAWVRVYDEDARAAASRADERLAAGDAPPLCGIPIGLKDLYAVAGKPLTASSRALDEVPDRDCEIWERLSEQGMVLLGHLHTHEFAIGGTTDQVGNPWALDRSAGGSSAGSTAALAARMVPATTGTDTAGSLRIPSALCGTSSIKPTRGLLSLRGVVPLSVSLDHAGPICRTLGDCSVLLAGMAGPDRGRPWTSLYRPTAAGPPAPRPGAHPLAGTRLAVSPRIALVEVDPDVASGFDRAVALCRELGAEVVGAAPVAAPLDVREDFFTVVLGELAAYHSRFDDRRELYRPFLREWMRLVEERSVPARAYVEAQGRRRDATAAWADWFASERISAIVEPTVPVVAPPRGTGYERPFQDDDLISLTHYWDWIGVPAVSLPSGLGVRSGLPVGVSLVGPAGSEEGLLRAGIDVQERLGVPAPPL